MDEQTIFLSYARKDNELPSVEQERAGWVRHFYEHLICQLEANIGAGRCPYFWRDVDEIERNEAFDPLIDRGLNNADYMLSIVSPTYLERPYCQKELNTFTERVEAGNEPDGHSRIIKIIKNHVDEDELPGVLQGREGWRFFDVIERPGGNAFVEPYYASGRLQKEQAYFKTMNEIVNYLTYKLKEAGELQTGLADQAVSFEPGGNASEPDGRTVIYLAKPSYDLHEDYLRLHAEIEQRGFKVLPAKSERLPPTGPQAEAMIEQAMADAVFSIHMIGRTAGERPDGAATGIVPMQLEIGQRRADGDRDFRRLIWLGAEEFDDPSQAQLAADLNQGVGLLGDDDWVDRPFEQFRSLVVDRLTDRLTDEDPEPSACNSRIYIICDREDEQAVDEQVAARLYDLGYYPVLSYFSDDAEEMADIHRMELQDCDAVLVYLGAAGEGWFRQRLRELHDLGRLGRDRPFAAKSLLVAPPSDSWKQRTQRRSREFDLIIDAQDGITAAAIAKLADHLGPPV